MHKNNISLHGQHNIRFSRQLFIMQPVTKTPPEKPAPQQHLGFFIPAAYAAHVVVAGLRAVYIGHGVKI